MSRRTRGLLIALAVLIIGVAIGLIVFFAIRAANRGNPLQAGRAFHIRDMHPCTLGRSLVFQDTSTATLNNDFNILTIRFAGGDTMALMVTSRNTNRHRFNADLVGIVDGNVLRFRMRGTTDYVRIYSTIRYTIRTEIRDGGTYYSYYYAETLVMMFTAAPPAWIGGGNAA